MLSIDAFIAELRDTLLLEQDISPAMSLIDDLGLDSFELLWLVTTIEEHGPSGERSTALPKLDTVADAYDYYRKVIAPQQSTLRTDD